MRVLIKRKSGANVQLADHREVKQSFTELRLVKLKLKLFKILQPSRTFLLIFISLKARLAELVQRNSGHNQASWERIELFLSPLMIFKSKPLCAFQIYSILNAKLFIHWKLWKFSEVKYQSNTKSFINYNLIKYTWKKV